MSCKNIFIPEIIINIILSYLYNHNVDEIYKLSQLNKFFYYVCKSNITFIKKQILSFYSVNYMNQNNIIFKNLNHDYVHKIIQNLKYNKNDKYSINIVYSLYMKLYKKTHIYSLYNNSKYLSHTGINSKLPSLPYLEELHLINTYHFIPHFSNLKILICFCCNVYFISSMPQLEYLDCSYNNLTSLPEYPKLKTLKCNNNLLRKLPKYPSLISLTCHNNNIKNLQNYPKLVYVKF